MLYVVVLKGESLVYTTNTLYHFNCHMGLQPWDIHNIAASKQRKPQKIQQYILKLHAFLVPITIICCLLTKQHISQAIQHVCVHTFGTLGMCFKKQFLRVKIIACAGIIFTSIWSKLQRNMKPSHFCITEAAISNISRNKVVQNIVNFCISKGYMYLRVRSNLTDRPLTTYFVTILSCFPCCTFYSLFITTFMICVKII